MPVKQITRKSSFQEQQELLDKLVAEWHSSNSAAEQPLILEERDTPDKYIHVYVIWDEWAHLDQLQRGELVMEAFERRYGHAEANRVTVTMGLTSAEAHRLGIHA
jgi:hypothetical protein